MVLVANDLLAVRILNDYRIPFYKMQGGSPGGFSLGGEVQGFEHADDADQFIVALIDDPEDIPEELRDYVTGVRTTDVLIGGESASAEDLKERYPEGLRTDQLEHDGE